MNLESNIIFKWFWLPILELFEFLKPYSRFTDFKFFDYKALSKHVSKGLGQS